jgi:LysR family glycine cleavage system transcriptional activator
MQHLPLTALRAFEAAARSGSFRVAADALHVTPSAVSHAIRGLEASLQTTLFHREGRHIALTAQGEALLRHVQQGFDELKRGIAAVTGRSRMLLRLHSAPSFAAQWLMPRLPRLLAERPGLDVRLAASTSYTLFGNEEYDLDIVYGVSWAEHYRRSRHPRVVVLSLGEETVTPLCSPAQAERIRTLEDLAEQTLIESEVKQVRWPAWFATNGVMAPDMRGPRFDRSFLSISAAADGLGVALESTRLAERELASGRLVRPLPQARDVVYIAHWLAFPRAERYRPELLDFLGWIGGELGVQLDPLAAS